MDSAAPRPTRICIIGGGFSGAVVAVQLARHLADAATIEIIEPREMLGGGVAYSATDPSHRINVPAAKMVVFGEDPLHFARWLEEHNALDGDPSALWESGAAFPQRAVFGRYLAGLVEEARIVRPDVTIRHRRTVAASIHPKTGGYVVSLADGKTLPADTVVLAVSHPPPAVPSVLLPAFAAGAPIIADPWSPGALDDIPADAQVLVVGTGLTMADAIATLDRRHHRGPILAISRRGLLSRGHPAGDFPVWSFFASADLAGDGARPLARGAGTGGAGELAGLTVAGGVRRHQGECRPYLERVAFARKATADQASSAVLGRAPLPRLAAGARIGRAVAAVRSVEGRRRSADRRFLGWEKTQRRTASARQCGRDAGVSGGHQHDRSGAWRHRGDKPRSGFPSRAGFAARRRDGPGPGCRWR